MKGDEEGEFRESLGNSLSPVGSSPLLASLSPYGCSTVEDNGAGAINHHSGVGGVYRVETRYERHCNAACRRRWTHEGGVAGKRGWHGSSITGISKPTVLRFYTLSIKLARPSIGPSTNLLTPSLCQLRLLASFRRPEEFIASVAHPLRTLFVMYIRSRLLGAGTIVSERRLPV